MTTVINKNISVMNNVPSKLCTHKGREISAHKKPWSARNVDSKIFFAHKSYMSFQIKMNSGKMLHKRNFLGMQTLKKLKGTLVPV